MKSQVLIMIAILLGIYSTLSFFLTPATSFADGHTSSYEPQGPDDAPASPKQPWGEFTVQEEKEGGYPWWAHVLLWLPNRVMDLVDVARVDIGVGPAYGGVIRVSQYGQVGYRQMAPSSVRIGDFGRRAPFMVESSNEYGVGPGYVKSKDRKVCPGELGAGLDLLIVGAYGGVCTEELFDFVAGLFFIDLTDDDLK